MPTLAAELRPLFAGRKVVLTGAPLAALTGLCRRLRDLGAERPFLLATGQGTGEAPGPDEAERYVVELRAPDVMSEIRASMRLLGDLPADVLAALDRWDPERRALVLSPMFNELPQVAGRRVYGPRRPEARRLEDKVVVDGLWDDLGVTRAPSEVVAAEPEALRAAARRLDRGAGTAWAGDAREGFHGGASLLRWVRDEEDATEAAAFLAARCDRARVMLFLEGVPCSIHGMVFPRGVAAGAGGRRPLPRRRRLDGHRGRQRRHPGAAGGVRGRRLPAGGRRRAGLRRALVRPVRGRRVRPPRPRPRPGAGRPLGGPARRGRVRRADRWFGTAIGPAGAGPAGPLTQQDAPRCGARPGTGLLARRVR
jgi:hypothetical protein